MRRFEPRSKHAPMDFTYDSDQRARGGSPFRLESARSDPQFVSPTFGSSSPSKIGSTSGWTFGTPNNNNTSFSFTSPPTTWTPPTNFSPERAFPPLQPSPTPEAEMADVSLSTAGSETPDASPTLARQAARGASGSSSKDLTLWTSGSPLRRSTFKTRDHDRSRDRERALEKRRGMSRPRWEDADSDEEGRPLVPEQIHFHMPEAKSTHGDLPYVLSGYVQFFFNLSLLLLFLYLLVLVVGTIRRDVDERIAEYSANALREIAQCTNTYLTNRCGPETRIPLMEATCRQLEECMNQDPSAVGRARVAAETFAQVANGFVEEISWKTLGFTLVSLGFLIAFTNTLLFLYRARHATQLQTATTAPVPPSQLIAPHIAWGTNSWQNGGLLEPETPRRKKTALSKPS